jgi:hypothetical protein
MTTLGVIYLGFWTKNPTNVEKGFHIHLSVLKKFSMCLMTWVIVAKLCLFCCQFKILIIKKNSRWPWFTMLNHYFVKIINWTQSLNFNRIVLHPPSLTISSLNIWNLLNLILSKLCIILKNIFSKLSNSLITSCRIGLKFHLDLCPKFYSQSFFTLQNIPDEDTTGKWQSKFQYYVDA